MQPLPSNQPRKQRFPLKKHRMTGDDFKRAYAKGSRARGGLMTVAVCENGLGISRMGLSIGKRCQKSAVKRNRVRRVFREAFRLSLQELPVGIDVVLIGSTPKIEPNLADTMQELESMVRKAHRRYLAKRAEQAEAGA